MSRVIELYDTLHAMPELGFEEFKTAEFLANALKKAGYTVSTGVGGTGVIGVYDSGVAGPTLALRADIDALGHFIDGKLCALHSCGHDAHASMVLAAAEEIMAQKLISKGKLKILFQPAEEPGTGALAVIKAGAIDDVDMILGLHVRPLSEVPMGKSTPALYHGASNRLKAIFHGVAAHGARPHLGVNAIDAAVAAITAVNAIHLNPSDSYSIKATKMIADAGVTNAIPDEATVIWDVRSELNDTMDLLLERATSAISAGAATVSATAEISTYSYIPAAHYSKEAIEVLSKAIVDVYGKEGLAPEIKTVGGEDFHYYIKERPSIKAGYFGLGCDLTPGLHNPNMKFNKNAMEQGKEVLICATKRVLN
ncbi:amidohydrolase [Sulfurospirillum oryzae]|uniref:amidohydrolase n=1 Tax=Sulfurospirillum oryzae TaxID=2976535 RepID=UPI0021E93222|nr:amidohydrolase [Sulfurospirillum oryzae]